MMYQFIWQHVMWEVYHHGRERIRETISRDLMWWIISEMEYLLWPLHSSQRVGIYNCFLVWDCNLLMKNGLQWNYFPEQSPYSINDFELSCYSMHIIYLLTVCIHNYHELRSIYWLLSDQPLGPGFREQSKTVNQILSYKDSGIIG